MDGTFLPHEINQKISDKISEQNIHPGLYIVSTPIGNIFDITFRAIFILQKSDYIFAEDTRVTKKLLSFYGIKGNLVSCNNYTELKEEILKKIDSDKEGIFSVVSDAGTPLISDPGYKLINWCIEKDINIYPIPGACSAIAGLCISGLPTDKFHFYGFLPTKEKQKSEVLSGLKSIMSTLIFLESPNRLLNTLKTCLDVFGDRNAFVGRELTKLFEDHRRGKISDLISFYESNPPLGEIVLVLDGNKETSNNGFNIEELLMKALQNSSLKEAVNKTHIITGEARKSIYEIALKIKNNNLIAKQDF